MSHLIVAREDNWETSTKIVGIFPTMDDAIAYLNRKFYDVEESKTKHNPNGVWEDKFTDLSKIKSVKYFYGKFNDSYRNVKHNIVIIEFKD